MFLFASVLLMFYLPFSEMLNFDLTDADMYGKMLIGNEQLVISIIDRTYPSFAIYRPYSSNDYCRIYMNFLSSDRTYIMLVAISRDGSAASNKFFFQGVKIDNDVIQGVVLGVVGFSMSPCGWLWYNLINFPTPTDYPLLGVSVLGDIYLYADDDYTYIRDINSGNSSFVGGRPWPDGSNFISYTIDIAYGGWGVIAGVVSTAGIYVPTLYLITFPSNVISASYNLYSVIDRWTVPFAYPWQRQKARRVSGSNDFEPIYGLSLSINDQGDILFGVQSMNTVFHLYVNSTNATSFIFKSSRIPSVTIPSIGFGKSVAWLDNTTAVILANNISLDYTTWCSSQIHIYDLDNGKQLSDIQTPYSSFPTAQQSMYSLLTGRILLMTATYTGTVIFMDSNGQVYIILPSPSGYYSATNVGNSLGSGVYFSSPSLCSEGTSISGYSGNKYLFDTCKACPQGTFRPTSINISAGCTPCDTSKYFCPLGAVAAVPLSYIDKISQVVTFPRSPDLTGFEDILLINMFSTNFKSQCLITTPFFWTLIMISVTLTVLITMNILEYIGKCKNFRTQLEAAFKHFDIIHDGERWMSGVLSLSIFVIIIFAALFTNSFIKQYPKEKSRAPDFSCDETLRNSKFSSQMQSLGAAIPDNAKSIFNLLQLQRFTLKVTLLNTIVNTDIIVQQTVGTITTKIHTDLSIPTDGCLVILCNLTANIATINITILSSQTIGGVRISLLSPSIVNESNEAKELYFANSFTISNRTMSQEPYFNIELIQVINETKSLAINDISQFNGLWIPVFTKDDGRNFYTENDYEKYHTKSYTILTIDINQATYYIYNVEKPIIKTTGVIFKNILFASMCMELFAFGFLIFKLVIVPLVRLIIRVIRSKKEKNDNDESEKEEEEEEEIVESEDDDELPTKTKLEPAINEWYIPDVQT